MRPAVVLLSGGLDSTTALAVARSRGFDSFALSFRYGQRHGRELDAAPPRRRRARSPRPRRRRARPAPLSAPGNLLLLEDAKELDLEGRRQLADLVEKERPAVRLLEEAALRADRVGEGTLVGSQVAS
jgi:hypothetical protein